MFETIVSLVSNPMVHTLLGVVVGWLALPMPGGVANSFWGQLLSPIFGTQGASNLSEVIQVVMSILKLNGSVSVNEPTPTPKLVQRVLAKRVSLTDAANSHMALKMSMKSKA